MNSTPFLIRLVAATITGRQNQCLLAELAYLRNELAITREHLPQGTIIRFTDAWRIRLAVSGAAVGWKRLAEIATVAKAKTIQGWDRLRRAGKLGIQRQQSPGHPRTAAAIEKVVLRMAKENPTWGQLRIAGMLILCLITLSPRTIGAILKRNGEMDAPERTRDHTWKKFITDKADVLVATDFFTVDVWRWFGKQTYDVLFAIHIGTRKVKILGVTEHSNEAYMAQVARNETMEGGWLKKVGCEYLIHDRDTKFCDRWKDILGGADITLVPTQPMSPNLNAFAERWVRTVKRECIRKCWFLGYGGLCRVLDEYVEHYNAERPHQGMGNRPLSGNAGVQAPAQQSIAGFKPGDIKCVTRCEGTIRHYYRVAA